MFPRQPYTRRPLDYRLGKMESGLLQMSQRTVNLMETSTLSNMMFQSILSCLPFCLGESDRRSHPVLKWMWQSQVRRGESTWEGRGRKEREAPWGMAQVLYTHNRVCLFFIAFMSDEQSTDEIRCTHTRKTDATEYVPKKNWYVDTKTGSIYCQSIKHILLWSKNMTCWNHSIF